MSNAVDYYFTMLSPWSYMGHTRFVGMAKDAGITIKPRPVNFAEIFPKTGGFPLQ